MARKDVQRKNHLLTALPLKERTALFHRYERVDLELGHILAKAGRPMSSAYFPESGMISLVQTLEDGAAIEVGLVGSEGFLGVPLIHGTRSSQVEAMVQGAGVALRIPANALILEAARSDKLRALLLRYAQAMFAQVVQTAACNGRHALQQRLARWLLEAQDRIGGEKLPLSHELIGYMLGCRRSGVTIALGALKATGVLNTGRNDIRIVDRKGLERAACECYRTVQSEFRRLLP